MRILALRGQNLASLAAPFELDFTTAPLKHAGVYAICGPTGAGKSTLLDTLCLALYHRTPRLEEGSALNLHDVGDDLLGSKDPRQWLRRGASQGFAEVDFVGIDGAAWRARWSVKRARGSSQGRLQAAEARLQQLGTGATRGNTISEVRDAIKACVGLDFAQFTRAVLLAQNQFSRFLHAPANERAQLLEALTGAQIYSRLSKAAFERARETRQQLELLEQSATVLVPLSAEQRQALADALAIGVSREVTIQAELQSVHAGLAWHERLRDLQNESAAAQLHWNAAQQQLQARAAEAHELRAWTGVLSARPLLLELEQSEQQLALCMDRLRDAQARQHAAEQQLLLDSQALSLASERELLSLAALREARPRLKQARELDQQCATARVRLQDLRSTVQQQRSLLDRLQEQCSASLADVAAAELREQQLRQWCDAHGEDAALAQAWPRLELLLEANLASGQSLQQVQAQRDALRIQWQQVKAELHVLSAAREHQQQRVQAAEQLLQRAQEGLQQMQPEQLHAALHAHNQAERSLQQAQQTIDAWQASLLRWQGLDRQWQVQQQQCSDGRAQLELLEQQLPALQAQAQTCARLSTQARTRADQQTVALRAQLEAQQPCPVCGATEHPYAHAAPPADARLAELLAELERASAAATAQLEAARAEQLTWQTRLQDAAQRQPAMQEALQQAQAELARLRRQLLQLWAEAPDDLPLALNQLHDRSAELQRSGAALAAREQQVQHLQRAEREAQDALRTARAALDAVSQELECARAAHQETEVQGQLLSKECERLELALQQSRDDLQQHSGWPADCDPHHLDAAVCAELAQRARVWNQQQVLLRDNQQTLQRSQQQLDHLQQRLAQELPILREQEQAEHAAVQFEQASRATRLQLHPDPDTEGWQTQLEGAVELAQSELARRRAAQASASGAAHSATVDHAAAEQAAQAAQQRQLRAAVALDDWLVGAQAELPGLNRAQLSSWLDVPQQRIEQRRLVLLQLEEQLQREQLAAQQASEQLAQWQATSGTYPDAAVLAEQRQGLSDELHQLLQQRGALQEQRNADERIAQRHAELQGQIAATRETVRTWAQLNELIGSADGAKFRKLAQQYTLDLVLAYANVHLHELAARYQLRREAEHLLIVDADLGGAIRAVSSLSGGETFLVSLALALGLASLTAQRMRIESLFIDEGFGALDEANLRLALDVLDRLQAQGRKIGVISHLPELTERIGTRIEVRRIGPGTSEVHVCG